MENKGVMVPVIIVIAFLVLVGPRFFKVIPVGHVGVAALFGQAQDTSQPEGLQFPVNPLLKWYLFDARQKTHMETSNVPTQDQLQTKLDVSVQYRISGTQAAQILKDTGSAERAIDVHLIPKLRSLVREQGKSIKRAEDFFLEKTQETLQASLEVGLKEFLAPKGIEVQAVLIRDITLPPFITKAIESKKEREQSVERQKAELERFRTEQDQKIALAEAERKAAEMEAQKKMVLADAQAYEILKINEAIAQNPAYLQLEAMNALKAISRDPSTKIYFLNGDSPSPLPLMHIGEQK